MVKFYNLQNLEILISEQTAMSLQNSIHVPVYTLSGLKVDILHIP